MNNKNKIRNTFQTNDKKEKFVYVNILQKCNP